MEKADENNHRPVEVNVPKNLQVSKSVHQYFKNKLCSIPATAPIRTDPFVTFIPKPRTVVHYDVEQTETEIKRPKVNGCLQIHVRETRGLFKPAPPDYEFPEDKIPKPQYCSGGPPCWEFRREKYLRHEEKRQEKYRKNLKFLIKENRRYDRGVAPCICTGPMCQCCEIDGAPHIEVIGTDKQISFPSFVLEDSL
ncbi:hypothetical protein FQR65_LT10241 [Abscondita terminalis]|nr:hypothetical protein FQR65_LT10241 [Abscondita terminalis]